VAYHKRHPVPAFCREPNPHFCGFGRAATWGSIVVSRNYFARQAKTLLKFAQSTSDPKLAAALVEKASDLKSRGDESGPPLDQSPIAPDVMPET
jgi:hypothetical protein